MSTPQSKKPSGTKPKATSSAKPAESVGVAQPAAPEPQPVIAPKGQTNMLALWSMILGIFNITFGWFLPIPTGIAAVVLGHIGLSQIKRTGQDGRAFAVAGLVTGYLGIAITTVFVVMAAIVFFTWMIFGGHMGYLPGDMMYP